MSLNVYKKRLTGLRAAMKKKSIDALIVPITDPHLGEYVPEHWRVIEWLTGFTGSAATVVITSRFAGLWTDSRYFIQAEEQLQNSGFELVKLKIPHTPEYIDWLASTIKKDGKIAVDGRVISIGLVRLLETALEPVGASLNIKIDLIKGLWTDRPPLPTEPAFDHPVKYAGRSRADKISDVRARMAEMGADYQLCTSADDIMWLLNIRGNDISFSPLVISFALIGPDQVLLFADEEKVPGKMKAAFDGDNVVILPYDMVSTVLASLADNAVLLLSPGTTSASIFRSIPRKVRVKEDVSIPTRLKAIKNSTEIANIREVMVRDGVALTRFFIWLENNIGRERITELSASEKLETLRREQDDCMGPSFATIAAYNAHAALPHYAPSKESDTELKTKGIFLLDSGGQYLGGTTDVTRTVALSKPDKRMKSDFTLALKGTVNLAMARFPSGTKGFQLEILARKALWDNGLNYGHGTGHGVGFFLNVHEGPQTIGTGSSGDLKTVFEPGMLTADEPAIYRPGEYGFRTENLILCVDDVTTDHGTFLKFETVTHCYIDTSLIETSLLDERELKWLNDYHSNVFRTLSPHLKPDEKKWLKGKTAAITRKK
ncbi:MAG TPA: aminopeptidase P family protein [Bacteroidales bacterium]|nr:aminopeptidase P family protein [Bacteroidales bacterium]